MPARTDTLRLWHLLCSKPWETAATRLGALMIRWRDARQAIRMRRIRDVVDKGLSAID
jgi:hypothetical protein